MGKCLRSCGGGTKQRSSAGPVAAEAAAYLTLRSGRRVPAAAAASACGPRASSRRCLRRGAAGPAARRCGAAAAGCSPRRSKSAGGACRQQLGGGRPEELPSQAQARPAGRDDDGVDCCEARRETPPVDSQIRQPLSGEVLKHGDGVLSAARSPSPVEAAEMEAFFAAAELAERRRFAETYNYDVALDRPLDGRFEWSPVST
ncbi:hypothetical protein ACP4OV_008863 [Aristida adscensionis]